MTKGKGGAGDAAVPFKSAAAFRAWLAKHHEKELELFVRCRKVKAAVLGVTYKQALDEALCFGWIDGVRHRIDDACFSVRFTPRKSKSKWSAINVKRVRELDAEGRMKPAGLAVFTARDPKKKAGYSFESRAVELSPALEKKLRAHKAAWAFFEKQAPWYRRVSKFWVMSAKREETRARRLDDLIARSAAGKSIPPLART